MPTPTTLITGLGLMGGSLAAALAQAGWRVLLHHRRPEVATRAAQLGYGEAVDDPIAAMARADLAVVCVPVGVIAETVRSLTRGASAAVVTDVGSVKGSICDSLAALGRSGRFVGSHPMAGSHLQGLEHARADLYRGCTTAVTPMPGCPEAAVARVESLWVAVGSRTRRIAAQDHDAAVAAASHLPHVAAALAAAGLDADAAPLAATGFRDTTRVAAGSPELWTDILLHNRAAVAAAARAAGQRLATLVAALERGDAAAITAWLQQGRDGRRRFEHEHHLAAEREATAEE